MKADRKAIKRNLMDLIEFGYDIEYSESIRISKKGEEETIYTDWCLVREFSDAELRFLIDGLLFSKHIPYSQYDACVLAYYMAFEKTQLRGLAELFPDLADHLRSITENMRDLYAPFSHGHYYCKEMGGGRSIKAVLPALFPNDPQLDYTKLDLLQCGSVAMEEFASLHEKSPDEAPRIRAALLAYCKLNTLALVKILEWLRELAE